MHRCCHCRRSLDFAVDRALPLPGAQYQHPETADCDVPSESDTSATSGPAVDAAPKAYQDPTRIE